ALMSKETLAAPKLSLITATSSRPIAPTLALVGLVLAEQPALRTLRRLRQARPIRRHRLLAGQPSPKFQTANRATATLAFATGTQPTSLMVFASHVRKAGPTVTGTGRNTMAGRVGRNSAARLAQPH